MGVSRSTHKWKAPLKLFGKDTSALPFALSFYLKSRKAP